jgi:hypothetical protein
MELQDIYFVAEIVGVVAIIGSLLFVGAQMRQNTNALRASVENDMLTNWQANLQPMVSNQEFVDAMARFNEPNASAELSRDAETRLSAFWLSSMKNVEFSYYRHLAGEMDDALWIGIKNAALDPFNKVPMRETIWPFIRTRVSPQFVTFIEEAVLNGEHLNIDKQYGEPLIS